MFGLEDPYYANFFSFLSSPWKSNQNQAAMKPSSGKAAAASPESSSTESLSDAASGYFPLPHRTSISSDSSAQPEFNNRTTLLHPGRADTASSDTASTLSSSSGSNHPLDTLSREFPKPTEELSVEEMLARPPQKWSLGHYVKNAREAKPIVQDKEQQAKDFAQVKKELLLAKEELKSMSIGMRR